MGILTPTGQHRLLHWPKKGREVEQLVAAPMEATRMHNGAQPGTTWDRWDRWDHIKWIKCLRSMKIQKKQGVQKERWLRDIHLWIHCYLWIAVKFPWFSKVEDVHPGERGTTFLQRSPSVAWILEETCETTIHPATLVTFEKWSAIYLQSIWVIWAWL